jgi:hypothetical protein
MRKIKKKNHIKVKKSRTFRWEVVGNFMMVAWWVWWFEGGGEVEKRLLLRGWRGVTSRQSTWKWGGFVSDVMKENWRKLAEFACDFGGFQAESENSKGLHSENVEKLVENPTNFEICQSFDRKSSKILKFFQTSMVFLALTSLQNPSLQSSPQPPPPSFQLHLKIPLTNSPNITANRINSDDITAWELHENSA